MHYHINATKRLLEGIRLDRLTILTSCKSPVSMVPLNYPKPVESLGSKDSFVNAVKELSTQVDLSSTSCAQDGHVSSGWDQELDLL